jgi:hypothetical protein
MNDFVLKEGALVKRLAKWLYAKRCKLRLSMAAVSRAMEVSTATYYRLEHPTGIVPSLDTFVKCCVWLDISADAMLGLKGIGYDNEQ